MANVTYDDRSFLIDGQRIWLVSGSVHYFRVPHELWGDRLLKAKRAGLNCITTYVAWNFHEPSEGEWQLDGDHDVVEFVRLAEELGLYVILRPGPYICAEWDFGGLPSWLTAKSGMAYRTSNAAFTHYFDKYFRQVLPRLAELQVTRGGNIVLVQNENEYMMTTMPDRLSYLEFVTQLLRRSGFDVPIITCNWFSDPPVPEAVDCVNAYGDVVTHLKNMRARQGDAPLLVTEYWDGWFDQWGGKHAVRDAREVARKAVEMLGCGAQFNYYMWHGGTNFAFWGSRLVGGDDWYQTTSYDYDAPLAEGGALTPKYYLTKLVNMLAQHMGPYIAPCIMDEPGATLTDVPDVRNLHGPAGRWAIVTNNGRDDITTADLALPGWKTIRVPLEPLGATAIPIELRLSPETTLDFANVMPLGFFGEKVLVLHGPAGFEAHLSVNGKELRAELPAGDEPACIEHEGLVVVLVSSDLAARTWLVDETLVFGPRLVGETLEDMVHARQARHVAMLSMEGKLTHRKVKPTPARKVAAPRLGSWTRVRVCTEPVDEELPWKPIDKPKDLDRLGVHYGYAWYRAVIQCDRARRHNLFLPACEDRATLFLNGQRLGVWGRGGDARRAPIGASFKRGANVLTILADNLGRLAFGPRIGELKGLADHVYQAKPLKTRKFKVKQADGFSRRIIPRQLVHLIPQLEKLPVHVATVDIPLTKVTPLHLSFADISCHVAVLCNERAVGIFPSNGANWGDVTLGPELRRGKNVIQLILWGELGAKDLDRVKFHVLEDNLTEKARWSFLPWTPPQGEGPIVGKDRPAWYVARFKYVPHDAPLFLNILSAKKGHIFLNGHNLGRFWNIGPQQRYYLPECWLEETNELMVFEEHGAIPANSRLEYCPDGPYGD